MNYFLVRLGGVTLVCAGAALLLCFVWLLGWLTVFVVNKHCVVIGVHREVPYFIRNRKELRMIIAKRREVSRQVKEREDRTIEAPNG